MRRALLLSVLALCACTGTASAATTISVCPSGCDQTTIQAAVTAAHAGDTVDIHAGAYDGDVIVAAGKDGLTIRGAQAGHPADSVGAGPRPSGETVITSSGTGGFWVMSANFTLDGVTLSGGEDGVFNDPGAPDSGLRVLNSIFINLGTGIVPQGDGAHPDFISHNAFIGAAPTSPFLPGAAIGTDSHPGALVIDHNLFRDDAVGFQAVPRPNFPDTFPSSLDITDNRVDSTGGRPAGALVSTAGGTDVTIARNTVTDYATSAIVARHVHGLRVTDNTMSSRFGSGFPSVYLPSPGPGHESTDIDIERNNIAGSGSGGIHILGGAALGTVQIHFNRVRTPQRFLTGVSNLSEATVDATENWWGCNAGPSDSACSSVSGDRVDTSPWLVLRLDGPDRITDRPGAGAGLSANLLHDSDGNAFDPYDFLSPAVTLATSGGLLDTSSPAFSLGSARAILTDDGSNGADVHATLDGQTVTHHVDFGPAPPPATLPGPAGDDGNKGADGTDGTKGTDGAKGPNGPTGPDGVQGAKGQKGDPGDRGQQGIPGQQGVAGPQGPPGTCTIAGTSLSCSILGSLLGGLGTHAALYRDGRRSATASVSVKRSGKKKVLSVRLRSKRKLRPGHYVLVITRGKHRVLRQVVTVHA